MAFPLPSKGMISFSLFPQTLRGWPRWQWWEQLRSLRNIHLEKESNLSAIKYLLLDFFFFFKSKHLDLGSIHFQRMQPFQWLGPKQTFFPRPNGSRMFANYFPPFKKYTKISKVLTLKNIQGRKKHQSTKPPTATLQISTAVPPLCPWLSRLCHVEELLWGWRKGSEPSVFGGMQARAWLHQEFPPQWGWLQRTCLTPKDKNV